MNEELRTEFINKNQIIKQNGKEITFISNDTLHLPFNAEIVNVIDDECEVYIY